MYKGSKAYGPKKLFDDASFSINAGEHVGVIGPNGAGKTTLFKVLTDQEQLDNGDLTQAKNLTIGYLAQHDDWQNESVEEFLSRGCSMPIWEMKSLGRGLGLKEEVYAKPITDLSGGYRMRCKLLKLLGSEPDLLLLDEPTNYLDLESLLALERFLQGYKKAFLLISHDREFLRRTTDHILEVEAGDIVKYNGSLDDYFEQKALLRTQLEARALSIEDKKKEILDFVARFGAKASKASQAQSRLKSLDKLESIEIKDIPDSAVIHLPAPLHTGKQILALSDVQLGYGARTILKDVSFQLNRGDHLAVVGVNGAGKSTFLKSLAGKLQPLSGTLKYGHEVSIGYYAQHVAEALNSESTVFEEMSAKTHPSVERQQVLNLAGALLFSGDDVHKKISFLSGGEKSRVALGQILLQKSPCLILDEPTNHLDFQTVEALTKALTQYEGTVVVVSHDRGFIRRIGTKILEVSGGKVEYYPGTYDEYVWSCQRGVFAGREGRDPNEKPAVAKSTNADGKPAPTKSNNYEERKNLERQLRKAEKDQLDFEQKIAALQEKIKTLNEKLVADHQNPESTKWIKDFTAAQSDVEDLETKWFAAGELQTELKQKLKEMVGG